MPDSERDQIRAELAKVHQQMDLVMELLLALVERRDGHTPYDLLNERGRAEREAIQRKVGALRREAEARRQ